MNRDFVEMLSALCAAGAEFLVVGAYALAVHGAPRAAPIPGTPFFPAVAGNRLRHARSSSDGTNADSSLRRGFYLTPGTYSARSVDIGLTRDARSAGWPIATTDDAARMRTTPSSVHGSSL